MSKRAMGNVDYCFNKVFISERKSLDKINPIRIIRKFCDSGNLIQTKKLFEKVCDAALANEYSWKEGVPGNLLYFFDELELLLEACYLLHIKKDSSKGFIKRRKLKRKEKRIEKENLPCMLSWEEFRNPMVIVHNFFESGNIIEWKQTIHLWLEAGLSNYSIIETIESKEILPYYQKVGKLIEASYLLAN